VTIEETDSISDPELLADILDTHEALEEITEESELAQVRASNQGTFILDGLSEGEQKLT
jgi:hypothetical protein